MQTILEISLTHLRETAGNVALAEDLAGLVGHVELDAEPQRLGQQLEQVPVDPGDVLGGNGLVGGRRMAVPLVDEVGRQVVGAHVEWTVAQVAMAHGIQVAHHLERLPGAPVEVVDPPHRDARRAVGLEEIVAVGGHGAVLHLGHHHHVEKGQPQIGGHNASDSPLHSPGVLELRHHHHAEELPLKQLVGKGEHLTSAKEDMTFMKLKNQWSWLIRNL